MSNIGLIELGPFSSNDIRACYFGPDGLLHWFILHPMAHSRQARLLRTFKIYILTWGPSRYMQNRQSDPTLA